MTEYTPTNEFSPDEFDRSPEAGGEAESEEAAHMADYRILNPAGTVKGKSSTRVPKTNTGKGGGKASTGGGASGTNKGGRYPAGSPAKGGGYTGKR